MVNLQKVKRDLTEIRQEIPTAETYGKVYDAFINDWYRTYVSRETPNSITKLIPDDVDPNLTEYDKQMVWECITENSITDLETLNQMKPIRALRLRFLEREVPVLYKER